MRRTGRGRNGVAVVLLVGLSIAGCDDFRDASLDNACGYDIEVANPSHLPSEYAVDLIEDGGNGTVYSSGGPFDVVVRRVGSDDWAVTIPWDELRNASEGAGTPFRVADGYCP